MRNIKHNQKIVIFSISGHERNKNAIKVMKNLSFHPKKNNSKKIYQSLNFTFYDTLTKKNVMVNDNYKTLK